MAKTHAQRQKEYREKKKAEGEKWLENETKRVKLYYKKTAELTGDALIIRRDRNRTNVSNYRERKKRSSKTTLEPSTSSTSTTEHVALLNDENSITSTTTEEQETSSQKLIVKIKRFPNLSTRKRVSRQVSKCKRQISSPQGSNTELKKKFDALRKKHDRLKRKHTSNSPKSKADSLMRMSGMSPRKHPIMRKTLTLGNCVTEEIQDSVKKNPTKKHVIKRVINGKFVRKNRLTRKLSKETKLNLRRVSSKVIGNKKRRMSASYVQLKDSVKAFMEREDNSRQMPGKADTVKVGKDKVQKYVLNDYLHNLHMKYRAENPEVNICLATFCRLRPKYITFVNFAERKQCLCSKHQNFALKLKCLKQLGVTNESSPDKFSDKHENTGITEMLSNVPDEAINFKQWKRVKTEDGKQRTKLIDCQKPKDEFTTGMESEFTEFCGHKDRVATQFGQFKDMKEKVKESPDHVVIHMDFAENYSCQSMEETQSAYWNTEMVTLHPVVVYYNAGEGELSHKSYVFVSDVLSHNTAMVSAIITKSVDEVKVLRPDVRYIHYWTDSPTSQYRNKTMFNVVASHPELYGVRASWQYFECGHGKGTCDYRWCCKKDGR